MGRGATLVANASIGVAGVDPAGDAHAALRAADRAGYRAERARRDGEPAR